MSKTDKSYLLKFEVLSESKSGNLVNGFSGAIGFNEVNSLGGEPHNYLWCTTNNNCSGGNCVPGCGTKADAVIICVLK
jgi:hypothetical protein